MRGPRLVSKYRISPSCSYEPKMPFGTVDREMRPSRSSCPSANTADEPGAGSLREASPAAGKVVAHRATRHKHGTALERKVLRAANILTSCVDILYDPPKDRTLNALSQYAVAVDPGDPVATDLREVFISIDRAQSVFEKAMRRSEPGKLGKPDSLPHPCGAGEDPELPTYISIFARPENANLSGVNSCRS